MSTPVAINSIGELRRRVIAGHHDFAILLAGGMMRSSKYISINPCDYHADGPGWDACSEDSACHWDVINEIDGSVQEDMTDREFWTQSNIGEALDKNALIDDDGDLLPTIVRDAIDAADTDAPATRLLEGPLGPGEVFDAFEVHDVAEWPDPSGGTYMEPLEAAGEGWEDEIVGRVVTLYGHFPSGGVHAIADAVVSPETFSVAEARDYARWVGDPS